MSAVVITVKLFASLARHLPAGARENEATLTAAEGSSVLDVIDQLGLPHAHCHLVLLDGVFVPRDVWATSPVSAGQVLALWPMVAGG